MMGSTKKDGPAEDWAAKRGMARKAIGLPNDKQRSRGNRYVAVIGSPDSEIWREMLLAGEASMLIGTHLASNPRKTFSLTRKGAERALNEGESLNPEDFPLAKDMGLSS